MLFLVWKRRGIRFLFGPKKRNQEKIEKRGPDRTLVRGEKKLAKKNWGNKEWDSLVAGARD